jgi:hypothetical protein
MKASVLCHRKITILDPFHRKKRRICKKYSIFTMTTTATVTAEATSSSGPIYVDTQHEDLVHDAQMDFYGSKLATCSSGKQEQGQR